MASNSNANWASYWNDEVGLDKETQEEIAKAEYLKDRQKQQERAEDLQKAGSALSTGKKIYDASKPIQNGGVFSPGLNWGNVAGIGAGLVSAYGAKQQWDSLDSTQGKLAYDENKGAFTMAANGAGLAAGGIAAGAYMGATYGSVVPIVGTVIGAALGAVAGKYLKKLKTGKHDHQLKRDLGREALQKANFLDGEGRFVLPDGSAFEMGKDGGFRYADSFRAYEVDHKDPLQGVVFGHALPIAQVAFKGDDKLISDFAGYFTRAAISNTKDLNSALDNLKNMAEKLNIKPDVVAKVSDEAVAASKIDQNTAAAYKGGIANVFSDNRNLNFASLFDEGGDFSSEISDKKTLATESDVKNKINKEVRVQVPKVKQAPVKPRPIKPETVSTPSFDVSSWSDAYLKRRDSDLTNFGVFE